MTTKKWDSETIEESSQNTRKCNIRQRGRWQILNRKHMMSCMRGWTLRKEKKYLYSQAMSGIELGQMYSGLE